MERVKVVF